MLKHLCFDGRVDGQAPHFSHFSMGICLHFVCIRMLGSSYLPLHSVRASVQRYVVFYNPCSSYSSVQLQKKAERDDVCAQGRKYWERGLGRRGCGLGIQLTKTNVFGLRRCSSFEIIIVFKSLCMLSFYFGRMVGYCLSLAECKISYTYTRSVNVFDNQALNPTFQPNGKCKKGTNRTMRVRTTTQTNKTKISDKDATKIAHEEPDAFQRSQSHKTSGFTDHP